MENFELDIKLTVAEANIVLAALGKLSIEVGLGVFQTIKSQAESQVQAASQAVSLAPSAEEAPE
jgi:hypothetical protein